MRRAYFISLVTCSALLYASSAHAVLGLDVPQMLLNIAGVLDDYEALITGFAYLMGLGLFFRAMYYLKVYGEARTMMSTNSSIKTPMMYMLAGSIFIYMPTAIDVLMQTTFGETNLASYSEWLGPASAQGVSMYAIFRIVQFVGLVSFIRGWMILVQGSMQGQQSQFGKGVVHIGAGILALNVVMTANILANTLGLSY